MKVYFNENIINQNTLYTLKKISINQINYYSWDFVILGGKTIVIANYPALNKKRSIPITKLLFEKII